MISPAVRKQNILKVRELIEEIPVAMLTTVDDETGQLRSRPMVAQRQPFDGTLWFFTVDDAPKTEEVQQDRRVNVTFISEARNLYVSLSGTATLVRDMDRLEEYWHAGVREWFPQGLDDPNLALLRVEVEGAEYWDGPDNAVQRLAGFVRAVASGEDYNGSENEKLSIQ